MRDKQQILLSSFEELEVSEGFRNVMKRNDIGTLNDLLMIHLSEIEKLAGFTAHHEFELFDLLKYHGFDDSLRLL